MHSAWQYNMLPFMAVFCAGSWCPCSTGNKSAPTAEVESGASLNISTRCNVCKPAPMIMRAALHNVEILVMPAGSGQDVQPHNTIPERPRLVATWLPDGKREIERCQLDLAMHCFTAAAGGTQHLPQLRIGSAVTADIEQRMQGSSRLKRKLA